MVVPSTKFYLRDFDSVVVTGRDSVTFIRNGTAPTRISPVDSQLVAEVLESLAKPVSARQLRQALDGDTLHGLVAAGIIHEGTQGELEARSRRPPFSRPCRHLVVGVTGAVNALHVMSMLPHLHQVFCDRLDVVFTQSALRFVNPAVLTYFGIGWWLDPFEARGEVTVPHIHLARTADLVAVLPASAASLQRLASGACSDLLSLIVAATEAPVLVAPSMNRAMWISPTVRRNVALLRADGLYVIEPGLALEVADGQKAQPEHGGMGASVATLARTLRAFLRKAAARSAQ